MRPSIRHPNEVYLQVFPRHHFLTHQKKTSRLTRMGYGHKMPSEPVRSIFHFGPSHFTSRVEKHLELSPCQILIWVCCRERLENILHPLVRLLEGGAAPSDDHLVIASNTHVIVRDPGHRPR